jgi:hypothetical protein
MSSRLLEFKPVPMVDSLRGVKAAARRYRGGLRASLDSSTLKRSFVRHRIDKFPDALKTQPCSCRAAVILALLLLSSSARAASHRQKYWHSIRSCARKLLLGYLHGQQRITLYDLDEQRMSCSCHSLLAGPAVMLGQWGPFSILRACLCYIATFSF